MTQGDDPDIGDDHWLNQAMEGEDAAGCISVGGLAVNMGWYKNDRGMTPDEIAAERERFIATRSVRNHPEWGFGDGIIDPESCGWLARAEIARVEQAELRAENERLKRENTELHALVENNNAVAEMCGLDLPKSL